MIWWFLILGLSTLAVVGAAIAMYMRVRQHMRKAGQDSGEQIPPPTDSSAPHNDAS